MTKEYFTEELASFIEDVVELVDGDELVYSSLFHDIVRAVRRQVPAVEQRGLMLQVAEQNGEFDINH